MSDTNSNYRAFFGERRPDVEVFKDTYTKKVILYAGREYHELSPEDAAALAKALLDRAIAVGDFNSVASTLVPELAGIFGGLK